MSRILAYRGAVIEHLKTVLGSAYTIEPHLGRFTEVSLEQSLTRAPAVYVAALGIPRVQPVSSGQIWAETQMLATTIVKDTGGSRRDAGSIAIIEKVIDAVHLAQPGASQALQLNSPVDISATNLTNPGLETTGVAIWAVTWRAEILLGDADPMDQGLFGEGFEALNSVTGAGSAGGTPDDEDHIYVAP